MPYKKVSSVKSKDAGVAAFLDKDAGVASSLDKDAGVAAFLDKVAATPRDGLSGGRGRLIFGMDATASRQPSWDRAARIQGQMFAETAVLGGLDLQLVFFRGFGEFKASGWVNDSDPLTRLMTSVICAAGQTQISKVLQHAINQTKGKRINALVYAGDCMEEDVDLLGRLAGELGLLGVPVFIFHEGGDPIAEYAFRQICRLSGGAYCPFDSTSAHHLKDLLSAVAVFAAGGRSALEELAQKKGGTVRLITNQMK